MIATNSTRRGISRVETIAIVAVAALTAGLGTWAWAWSREEARTQRCASILASYGQAFAQYAEAHEGVLPYENVGHEAHGHIDWQEALKPHLGPGDWVCPSVSRSVSHHAEGYRLNSRLARPGAHPPEPYRSLSTLDRPRATVMLFDAEYGGKKLSLKGGLKDAEFRHNGSLNVLFADWHVERLTLDRLTEASNWLPPRIIWDPDAGAMKDDR